MKLVAKSFLRIFFAFILVFTVTGTAKADYFVWQDPETGFSMTFPDSWKVVNNMDGNDLVTVMAPAGRGMAQCRARSASDNRYDIFPPRYDRSIQKIDFSFDFWDRYLKEYQNHEIYNVQNGTGLGRGFAGYAIAGYESAVPGPMMDRKALMFASLYHDRLYVLECSAHKDAFASWKGLFLSVAGSVDFRKAHYEMNTGNYRAFLNDAPIIMKGPEGQEVYSY